METLKPPTLLEGETIAVWMELSEAEEDYKSTKNSNDYQNGPGSICVTGRL